MKRLMLAIGFAGRSVPGLIAALPESRSHQNSAIRSSAQKPLQRNGAMRPKRT